MDDRLSRAIAAIEADHRSGASVILREALAVLARAAALGAEALEEAADRLCRAQPSMGAIWNAAGVALSAPDPLEAIETLRLETARANDAVVSVAVDWLGRTGRRTLVTHSSSGTVAAVIEALVAADGTLRVRCAEGRPVYEGRALAARLAAAGVAVELFTDAAVGVALETSGVLLLGADTVSADWAVNKVGSAALAALAGAEGVPVVVIATRDKFVPPQVAARLRLGAGPTAEVWESPPPGVTVRNPYFERVPLPAIHVVLTDDGPLSPAEVRRRCLDLAESAAASRVAGSPRC